MSVIAPNETPRAELLLKDCTEMFWELRELRERVEILTRENHNLNLSRSQLKNQIEKLKYENTLLKMNGGTSDV
jgi:regulator of replication initiation timing